MKLILLCLVVAIVFAKPKGSLPIGWLKEEATNAATDAAKDVAQKETDKAVEEASHVLKRMRLGRQRALSVLQSQMVNKQDDDATMSPADEAHQEYLRAKYSFGGVGMVNKRDDDATMSPADYEARQEYLRAKYSFGGVGIRV